MQSLDKKNVLVLGGSGFVGTTLQRYNPNWIYWGSRDCDLKDYEKLKNSITSASPDVIIHLAAKVGGIKENKENQALFFDENVLMNTNVVRAAHECNVNRLLASLSTCAFPDSVSNYPFDENNFFDGPPAETNFSYGFSKRMLHVQCMSYRKQFGRNYSTFCPSNIYGPKDNFDLDSSHFIPALIRKIYESTAEEIEMWGTGKPRRQQLYVNDLAKIIPILVEKHNTRVPLIVAPEENFSINEMCEIAAQQIGKKVSFRFNNKLDGQYRKDGSNLMLRQLLSSDFEFTKLQDGIRLTYEWYKSSR
jgi:GDP-L-fucose synthase